MSGDRSGIARIANISGFYGDKPSAAREILEGGEVDYLTGDYLAELTMLILHKARHRRPATGYARTFLSQMEDVLGMVLDRGIKVVVNAGGLDPAALSAELHALAKSLGLKPQVAHIEGDDLLDRLPQLQAEGNDLCHLDTGHALADSGVEPVSANAYLGAWGIVEALDWGADVVICPRVTDASLVVGPAAWHHGWQRDEWDHLASAVVAGHLIECGPQVTGGNYAFFDEVPDLIDPAFPVVEIAADGTFVVTKHPGTDGLVSIGTVTAQALYEIAEPRYANPDVIARFDSMKLTEIGDDRVHVTGVVGEPPTGDLKVCINHIGGFRNTVSFGITGLDVDEKASAIETALFERLGGREIFDEVSTELRRGQSDGGTNADRISIYRVTVKHSDPEVVGRSFSNLATHMLLSSVPGLFTLTPPSAASEFGVYWPTMVRATDVDVVVVTPNGERVSIPAVEPPEGASLERFTASTIESEPLGGPTARVALGRLFGARSGDKGGNVNVGVWARDDQAFSWLTEYLTTDRIYELLPDTAGLEVRRFEFANIRALNFVVVGLLGEGVASATRTDPQAKGFGEYLRSQVVDVPAALLE